MTTEKRKKLLQAMKGMSMADAVVEKKPKKKGQNLTQSLIKSIYRKVHHQN